jgi:hypothetical protein
VDGELAGLLAEAQATHQHQQGQEHQRAGDLLVRATQGDEEELRLEQEQERGQGGPGGAAGELPVGDPGHGEHDAGDEERGQELLEGGDLQPGEAEDEGGHGLVGVAVGVGRAVRREEALRAHHAGDAFGDQEGVVLRPVPARAQDEVGGRHQAIDQGHGEEEVVPARSTDGHHIPR